jgi:hypothetical protein
MLVLDLFPSLNLPFFNLFQAVANTLCYDGLLGAMLTIVYKNVFLSTENGYVKSNLLSLGGDHGRRNEKK